MPPRLGRRDFVWLALLCGAFVLLAVNVLFGARGFDRPNAGLGWRLIEAPGIALGWGGVGLLVVAMPYALVAWVRGKSPGKILAVLGTVVFAVGAAGLGAVLARSHLRGGGTVGAGLAGLLTESLGRTVAAVLLGAIAVPGLLLSLAPLLLGTSHLHRAGSVPQARAWYPQPQRTSAGEELPMQLAGTDVGPIRFRETPSSPPAPGSVPESVGSGSTETPAPAPPPPPPAPRARVIPGVRYADGGDADGPAVAEVAEPGTLARRRAAASEPSDAALPPGIRFAEPGSTESAPEPSPPPSVAESSEEAGEVIEGELVATATEAPPSPAPTESSPIDDGAIEPVGTPDPIARHRRKLAESVVFDQGRPQAAVATKPSKPKPPPPRPRGQKPEDIRAALRSLFTNLPLDELPPPRTPTREDAEPAEAEALVEDPNQLSLFTPKAPAADAAPKKKRAPRAEPAPARAAAPRPKAAPKAPAHPGCSDELYSKAVAAARERGSASLVHLKRALDIGYSRASTLIDAMVAEGILGEVTASGTRPLIER